MAGRPSTAMSGLSEAWMQGGKKAQAGWLLRDQDLVSPEIAEQIDGVLLTQNNWGGWARMAAPGKPVVNLTAVQFELEGEETLHSYIDGLNQLGYYVEDIFYLDNSLVGYRTMALVGLRRAEERENQILTAGRQESSMAIRGTGGPVRVTGLAGCPVFTGEGEAFRLCIRAEGENGRISETWIPIDGKDYRRVEAELDLTGMGEGVILLVSADKETIVEAVINLQISPAEEALQ